MQSLDGNILLLIHLNRSLFPSAVYEGIILHVLIGNDDWMQAFRPGTNMRDSILHNSHDPQLLEGINPSLYKLKVSLFQLNV